jgi:hypothetical protein
MLRSNGHPEVNQVLGIKTTRKRPPSKEKSTLFKAKTHSGKGSVRRVRRLNSRQKEQRVAKIALLSRITPYTIFFII